ncbi:flippase [Qipengyuania sp. DSG2-2]|uniref:flippase n=1 Tax=Qipengyuania sp. DGS2-2 TaxID=3349631 RepID=UPI0036D3CD8B
MTLAANIQRARTLIGERMRGPALKRISLAMGAGIMARLGLLALAVVVGRSFGPEDFGAFTFATGLALVVGQLAALGWPALMNRLIPALREAQDWSALRGLLRGGNFIILASSLTASGIIVLVAQFAGELSRSLLFAAMLVPPFAFCILRRQQLAAFRKAHFGMLFDQGFGAVCTVLLFLALGGMALGEAVVTYACMTLLGTLIAAFMVHRLAPSEIKGQVPTYRIRAWMALGLPILVGMSSKLLLGKTDVLLLAPLSNLIETGLYGSAYRITYLLSFPQVVLMTIVTPALGEAFAKRKAGQVRRVTRLSLAFTAVTVLPLLTAVLLFAEDILRIVFGAEFVGAAAPLRLLVVGQAASCFAMVFASMLIIGGREKAFAGWNALMLAANITLCVLLIPQFGAVGAALATCGVAITMLLGQIWFARPLWRGKMLGGSDAQTGIDKPMNDKGADDVV